MTGFMKLLMILSVLCFVLAIISNLSQGPMLGISAEGFSRGCTNLALIAIGMTLVCGKGTSGKCGE